MQVLVLLALLSVLVDCHPTRAGRIVLLRRIDHKPLPPNVMRNQKHYHYHHFHDHIPPTGMQRRFMWKQMDDTMDGFMDSMSSGARMMKQMLADVFVGSPEPVRYKKHIEYLIPEESSKVKYIMKTSPKLHKPFAVPKPVVLDAKLPSMHEVEPTSRVVSEAEYYAPSISNNLIKPLMLDDETLRALEHKEEKRVEEVPVYYNHQPSHAEGDIVSGSVKDFDESWVPVTQSPHTTIKSFPLSDLHTKIDHLKPTEKSHNYEVTEINAEESIHRPQAFQIPDFPTIAPTHYPSVRNIKMKKPHHKKITSTSTEASSRPRLMKTPSKIVRTTTAAPTADSFHQPPSTSTKSSDFPHVTNVMSVMRVKKENGEQKRSHPKHRGTVKFGEKTPL